MKPSEITNHNQLEVGRYYYLRSKEDKTALPEIEKCRLYSDGGELYYFKNCIWATGDNPQAFERWDIFGPISIPVDLVL